MESIRFLACGLAKYALRQPGGSHLPDEEGVSVVLDMAVGPELLAQVRESPVGRLLRRDAEEPLVQCLPRGVVPVKLSVGEPHLVRHHVHAVAVLVGEGLREVVQEDLAGAVGRIARHRCLSQGARHEEHGRPLPLEVLGELLVLRELLRPCGAGQHLRGEELRQHGGLHEADIHHRLVVLQGHLLDVPRNEIPRIVDEDRDVQVGDLIDYAKLVVLLLVPVLYLPIGEVELDQLDIGAGASQLNLSCGVAHLVYVTGNDDYIELPSRELFGHGEAEAVTTAGDECIATLAVAGGQVVGRPQVSFQRPQHAVEQLQEFQETN
jgi:hypothetical protein